MPDYPRRVRCGGGHIPTAVSIPWARAAAPDGRFRSRAELDEIYGDFAKDKPMIAYCRIGERSSHTWFVLTHLLGAHQGSQLRRIVDRVGATRFAYPSPSATSRVPRPAASEP